MKTIKMKIVLLVIGIVLLSGISIACVGIVYAYNSTTQKEDEIIVKTNQTNASEINSTLKCVSQTVDTLSNIAFENLDNVDKFKQSDEYVDEYTNKMYNTVLETAKNTKGAYAVYIRYNPEFTKPTSGLFIVKSQDDKFVSQQPTDFSIYDSSDLAHVGWYYIPVNNKKPTWLNPYLNENINVYMVSYVVPIYKNGVSIGIVGMDVEMPAITSLVDNVKLFDTGHQFLINADKTVAHSKKVDIGKSISEESSLKGIEDNIDSGKESEVLKYTYDDLEQEMTYNTLDNGMKLVTTINIAERDSTLSPLIIGIIITSVVISIICIIISALIGKVISKPIKQITDEVVKVSKFDFSDSAVLGILAKKKDETGLMAHAVIDMQNKLREIIKKIDIASNNIKEGFINIQDVVDNVNQMSTDNSATTEEIAAGMQETSANTEVISQSIGKVKGNANDINTLTLDGNNRAKEINQRAVNLSKMTEEATIKTNTMYEKLKENMDKALEEIKAVEKINELTASIMDISSQTSLLSLNASIESARAGEAGKGFSVVASEIGELSNQTQSTVENIQVIIGEVNEAVSGMSECMKQTIDFINNNVINDYKEFTEVGKQYSKDADVFDESMKIINDKMNILYNEINEISNSIEGINSTVGQATNAVTSIAQKTSDMVEKSGKGYEAVQTNTKSVQNLEDIVKVFKL